MKQRFTQKQLRADELRVESAQHSTQNPLNCFKRSNSIATNYGLRTFPAFYFAFCLFTFAFLICPCRAQELPTDYQVKAVFLEKFGKFVEWPAAAFAGSNAPLVIGILGDNPFEGALSAVAAKDTIDGRAIEVRSIKALPDLKSCQIVFVPATETARSRELLNYIREQKLAILTVGETADFYQAGGMIEFIIEEKQVHFRIANGEAREAGLKISSKLLSLAKP